MALLIDHPEACFALAGWLIALLGFGLRMTAPSRSRASNNDTND